MSLLDTASLVVTPNGKKAGKLYSVVPSSGAGDLDVTRATTATRVNSSGLIESVASNVPRLDYTNGTCPSILVEPQRTNLLTYSEQFDNAAWYKGGSGTVTANNVTAPDGTLTADRLTSVGDSSFGQSFTLASGQTYTFSVWLKAGTVSSLRIYSTLNSSAPNTLCSLTSEWQRFSLTFTVNQNGNVQIGGGGSFGSGNIYAWGAQLEAGSYATSYIPTTSASVTRNADLISKSGISSLIGQTEGTLFCEIKLQNVNSTSTYLGITSGTFANSILIGKEAGVTPNKLIFYILASGSTILNNTSISLTSNYVKCAIAYKSGSWSAYANGSLVASGTSTFSFSAPFDIFGFGSNATFSTFTDEMEVKQTALWKTRLTNTQLAQLTTI